MVYCLFTCEMMFYLIVKVSKDIKGVLLASHIIVGGVGCINSRSRISMVI